MQRTRLLTRFIGPLVLVCTVFASPAGTSAATPCPGADVMPSIANSAQVRAATLCLINVQRTSHGLAPLKSNRSLQKVALRYSHLMINQRFFGHVSPSGSTLVQRVRKGTRYLRGAHSWALGENLAWGSGRLATPAQTVTAWMNSPGHRRNILTPRFKQIGIGIANGAPVQTNGLPAATYTTDFGRRS